MPSALTYPGVYIQEVSSGVHTITGVATSITAFIGRAARGPVNEPVTLNSFADFERTFGGLWLNKLVSAGFLVLVSTVALRPFPQAPGLAASNFSKSFGAAAPVGKFSVAGAPLLVRRTTIA